MQEELIAQVLREVERRMHDRLPKAAPPEQDPRPTALLLGRAPERDLGWRYVSENYGAVIIGSLSAHALLHFPDKASLEALLAGKPVYLWENGLDYRHYAHSANRALWSRLLAAERQLRQWGVQPLREGGGHLITAQEARRLLRDGRPVCGRLTPLARDILEGNQ